MKTLNQLIASKQKEFDNHNFFSDSKMFNDVIHKFIEDSMSEAAEAAIKFTTTFPACANGGEYILAHSKAKAEKFLKK